MMGAVPAGSHALGPGAGPTSAVTSLSAVRTAVVICTKDRPQELEAALVSLEAQTRAPGEIVVVDGSVGDESRLRVLAWRSRLPVRYLHTSPPGLTRQRNVALAEATADVIVFIDDDSLLSPTYVAVVNQVLAADTERSVGAVLGRVVETGSPPGPRGPRRWLLLACQRLFLLPRAGSGTIQASGFQTLPHHLEAARDVACLSGGAMSFRCEVLGKPAFDEGLTGAGEMEDVDIARRLAGRTRIRYEPRAIVYHYPSAAGREPEAKRLRRLVRHHRHLYVKYHSGSVWRACAFWWSVLGLFTICMATGRWAGARRVGAEALAIVWRSRRTPPSGPQHGGPARLSGRQGEG